MNFDCFWIFGYKRWWGQASETIHVKRRDKFYLQETWIMMFHVDRHAFYIKKFW